MSLLRYIADELLDEEPVLGLFDHRYDLSPLHSDEFYHPSLHSLSAPIRRRHNRHRPYSRSGNRVVVPLSSEDDQFKVNMDIQQFKPEEINVKVVDDFLVVEAKHEERPDKHGFIARQFTRRYKLPKDVNIDAITSNISSDGILTVTAPKKIRGKAKNIREIPIIRTDKPALKNHRLQKSVTENGDKMET